MLWEIAGPFLSRLGEKLADYALGNMTTITNYNIILESLQMNLKSLSDKAFDVEKEVKNGEQSGMKKRKREVESWLAEVRKLEMEFTEFGAAMDSDGFTSGFFGGDRAQKLSLRVDRLVDQSQRFGELLHACEPEQVPLLTKKLVGENFEKNFEMIWDLLVNDGVSSIGIHGMGGVGKTTLAKHVHNRFVEGAQHVVIWITVSQTFSIKNLQDEVAKAVNVDLSAEHSEDKRAARLNRVLSQRNKVLLIFDDVWEKFNLEHIGDPLSLNQCRLIITTRSLEVCHQIGCQKVIPVKTLSKGESWSLFKETLGGGITLTSQVQEIAERMVEHCGGLPLGIITTAGSMKGRTDVCEWRNALTELNDSIMREDGYEERVYKILKYSFDRLDQGEEKHNGFTMVQHCFLNCCLYPEDSEIDRKELIELLISEGLLDRRRTRRKRVDQGHVILNKLVNVCLLENGNGSRQWVKMHDLVRAMALKITKNKLLRKDIFEVDEWSEDLEKISLMHNNIWNIPVELSPRCPKLSKLLLQNNYFLALIPGSFFLEMRGLHVLNMSYTLIKELPHSLSNLVSLKALLLSKCEHLKYVPDLGNLKELRELDISGTSMEELPLGMQELVNLECLKIGSGKLKKLPSNLLLNFQKLQCLHLPFYIEAPMTEIEKLKQLEEFCGRVKDMYDYGRLMTCLPRFKEYNRSYGVVVGEFLGQQITAYCDNEVFVNGMKLNEEGRRDVIVWPVDMKGIGFVKWEGLSSCMMDDIQGLNINIEPCKLLTVYECQGVECILKSKEFPMAMAGGGGQLNFPLKNLETMTLEGLPDLIGVVMFQSASPPRPLHTIEFSSLQQLHIYRCNKMKKMGLSLSLLRGLQNLEVVDVRHCSEIEEIFEGGNDRGGNRASSSQRLPIHLHMPKLRNLWLFQLPKLKSICDSTLLCSSIQVIWMEGCTEVKRLPLLFGEAGNSNSDYHSFCPPASLVVIQILRSEKEWWESLELEHPSLHPLLQPFLMLLPDALGRRSLNP
ncbi:probable disease resistance protein At1g61300 isoform X2 [Andrographis paniculata]|uniref:probable disease resistance protein At1g61300 isoform X2 n=2 Tax=Andrographis paniculata TaxID=175694 RepID=UPI0021E6FC03|nr:probable disease resistance protein At1g61300 isoform X2 [Andrographis paniculata]XP_051133186.1 probable disease resistance protein At1g61300 isoform X2 [Andrographis paniculata]XP_051133187.1 probable disease resistance protein At1g61300 isoform X2 [Andrographis paniculata]